VTIIQKRQPSWGDQARVEESFEHTEAFLADPKLKTPLKQIGDILFSPEALVAYPIVIGIPCLRPQQGILATRFAESVLDV